MGEGLTTGDPRDDLRLLRPKRYFVHEASEARNILAHVYKSVYTQLIKSAGKEPESVPSPPIGNWRRQRDYSVYDSDVPDLGEFRNRAQEIFPDNLSFMGKVWRTLNVLQEMGITPIPRSDYGSETVKYTRLPYRDCTGPSMLRRKLSIHLDSYLNFFRLPSAHNRGYLDSLGADDRYIKYTLYEAYDRLRGGLNKPSASPIVGEDGDISSPVQAYEGLDAYQLSLVVNEKLSFLIPEAEGPHDPILTKMEVETAVFLRQASKLPMDRFKSVKALGLPEQPDSDRKYVAMAEANSSRRTLYKDDRDFERKAKSFEGVRPMVGDDRYRAAANLVELTRFTKVHIQDLIADLLLWRLRAYKFVSQGEPDRIQKGFDPVAPLSCLIKFETWRSKAISLGFTPHQEEFLGIPREILQREKELLYAKKPPAWSM
jgi:hypothetical protein